MKKRKGNCPRFESNRKRAPKSKFFSQISFLIFKVLTIPCKSSLQQRRDAQHIQVEVQTDTVPISLSLKSSLVLTHLLRFSLSIVRKLKTHKREPSLSLAKKWQLLTRKQITHLLRPKSLSFMKTKEMKPISPSL